ncbi:nitroreductase family protein [Candidatus Laterigemmans baculatus]|uniref:nitroreductase family protein n=1 Tax=Candidatus Laterigemmans baculatus TaxID=2770505 RepID=UPI0013DA8C90|nr:nitroreductase family protein [Candidatus Laterigemmans baculatus]
MRSETDHEVLPAIAERWSPYRFEPRVVEDAKVLRCLEAARWAASSYNDQPWSFMFARRQDGKAFETALSCLLEANQQWAQHAGVLLLTVIRTTFRRNGKPNRVALHDLGAAAAGMALQATAEGLQVHQMAGVNLSRVRQAYRVPEGHEPQTAIAIGYPGEARDADDPLASRDRQPRTRLPLSEQVFAGVWGTSADLVR